MPPLDHDQLLTVSNEHHAMPARLINQVLHVVGDSDLNVVSTKTVQSPPVGHEKRSLGGRRMGFAGVDRVFTSGFIAEALTTSRHSLQLPVRIVHTGSVLATE